MAAVEISDPSAHPNDAPDGSSSVSDAQRLMARGVPIELTDGKHHLIFDWEGLELIEEEFSGVDVFLQRLDAEQYSGSRMRTVRLGLAAALIHERPLEMSWEEYQSEVRTRMDSRQIGNYRVALLMAITEAFPTPTASDANRPKDKAQSSHGNRFTGSPRSSTAVLRRSSSA